MPAIAALETGVRKPPQSVHPEQWAPEARPYFAQESG
jgi:hypothetical protein